jgi:hypothetical protein
MPNGAPQRILLAIEDAFGVVIVSEYEPQIWGYETYEEWDSAMAALAEEGERAFYDDVVKFVQGKRHNIETGTIGMVKAEIAKRLIAETPDLLVEEKRPNLIKAVNALWKKGQPTLRERPSKCRPIRL